MKPAYFKILVVFLVFFCFAQLNAQQKQEYKSSLPSLNANNVSVSIDGKHFKTPISAINIQLNRQKSRNLSLPQNLTYRHHSSSYADSTLFSFEYNENALLSKVYELFNFTDSSTRTDYFYDEYQRIQAIYFMSYTTGTWDFMYRDEYYYDAKGNDSLQLNYYYNSGIWEFNNQRNFYYTYSGDTIKEVLITDSSNSPYVYKTKYLYDYEYSRGLASITETVLGFEPVALFWYSEEQSTHTFAMAKDVSYPDNYVLNELIMREGNYPNTNFIDQFKITNMEWHRFYDSYGPYYPYEETMPYSFQDFNLSGDEQNFYGGDYYGMDYFNYFIYETDHQFSLLENCTVQIYDTTTASWNDYEQFSYSFDNLDGYTGYKKIYKNGTWQDTLKYEKIVDEYDNIQDYKVYYFDQSNYILDDRHFYFYNVFDEDQNLTHSSYFHFDTDNSNDTVYIDYNDYYPFVGDCQAVFQLSLNGYTLTCTNTSTGEYLYQHWDFGNGTVSDTNAAAFTYTYPNAGYYDICLSIFNENNLCYSDTCITLNVGASNACAADFSYNNVGYNYTFANTSSGTYDFVHWQFGDGEVSILPSPMHTYSGDGFYNVTLTIGNSATQCIDVYESIIVVGDPINGCIADYSYFPIPGTNKIQFLNNSAGAIEQYTWNFGDGQISGDMNPIHEYEKSGFYTVCLNVQAPGQTCYDMVCKEVYLSEQEHCRAKFFHTIEPITRTMNCTDQSIGDAVAWHYDYGDGYEDFTPNVTYSYDMPGIYLVSLEIETSGGCTDKYYSVAPVTTDPVLLVGLFGYENLGGDGKANGHPVNFKGAVYGEPSRAVWNFGDGTMDSSSLYPLHYYQDLGVYDVCLTVTNQLLGESYTHCSEILVGIDDKDFKNDESFVNIYPNPVSEKAIIAINSDKNDFIAIEIADITGRNIQTVFNGKLNKGFNYFTVNAATMDAGIYLVVLKSQNQTTVKRLVIE